MPWQIHLNGKPHGQKHFTQVQAQLEAIETGLLVSDSRVRRTPGFTPSMRKTGKRLRPGYSIKEVPQ